MSSFNTINNDFNIFIANTWLNIITTMPTNNNRITDYAKPLIDLLRQYDPSNYSTTNNQKIQLWQRQMYNFLFNECFITKRFSDSNWHVYRLWVMSEISFIIKNSNNIIFLRKSLIDYIQLSLSAFSINDVNYGGLIDFKHRDSISYQVYTLFAILQTIVTLEKKLALTQRNNTHNISCNKDITLRLYIQPAIDFVMPYLKGIKTYTEFINSNITSDKNRSDYGKLFNPESGNYLYVFMVNNDFI